MNAQTSETSTASSSSLCPETERELWRGVSCGDDDAREKLILAYRPMVFWLAKKFRVPYHVYPDLIQEGVIGLIDAVDHFEPERKNRFITYAYYRVRGRMVNFLQRSEAKAPLPVEPELLERDDSFEADLDRIEWVLALEEGFERLPEREMSVVRSLILEGRKASDVAAEHGVGVSHVYRLQRKAIAALKAWFSRAGAASGL